MSIAGTVILWLKKMRGETEYLEARRGKGYSYVVK